MRAGLCEPEVACAAPLKARGSRAVCRALREEDAELFEEEHVHGVYNTISSHFSHTRYSPWRHLAEMCLRARCAMTCALARMDRSWALLCIGWAYMTRPPCPVFRDRRYKPWPRVVEFLDSLDDGAWVADVGCGNGKFMAAGPRDEHGAFRLHAACACS